MDTPLTSRAGLVLRIFPADDPAFARAADEAVHEAGPDDPASAERALRRRFPSAAVRPSVVEGSWATWYIYREGHWIANRKRPGVATG
jgi:hypothetical protein